MTTPVPPASIALLAGQGLTADRVAAALAGRGVEAVRIARRADAGGRRADLREPASLERALAGIDRVYLIPPRLDPGETALIENALAACARAGVERVVYHSVLHPYEPDMPHHLRKLAAEVAVRRSEAEWTILQPASYAQNVIARLRRREGGLVLPSGWPADAPGMSVVDLDDVAAAAAAVLTEPGHADATYELAGPERLRLADMARVIAQVTGRACATEEWEPARFESGATPERLRDVAAYHRAYGAHGMPGSPRVLSMLLQRGATTFGEVVARELVPGRVPGSA